MAIGWIRRIGRGFDPAQRLRHRDDDPPRHRHHDRLPCFGCARDHVADLRLASRLIEMGLTRDRELWAMALHVEREHGEAGPHFISEQIERNAAAGEQGGVDLWKAVGRRYKALSRQIAPA